MLFNSFIFLLFFPIVCAIYWSIRSLNSRGNSLKYRNLFLLLMSYYFYMSWQPKYALLLLTSTGVTYWAARLMVKLQCEKQKLRCLLGTIAINLAILFFYKYYNFVAESITNCLEAMGLVMKVPGFDILLPVGISFYIFQALGYLIDVYRGEIKAERNFITYALFISFFPQLVAGPIERSKNLLKQFKEDRAFDGEFALSGLKLMLWGYFMKLCLADRCAQYVDAVFNDLSGHEGFSTLIASILFSFQIYGDFAGYTFIAIGCARIMNFSLNDNFHRPYFATTITDFWHRWHISLSTWLRDYVYFPLGGSRTTNSKTYRNIFITFLVSGIWHGANWTFVLWGVLHGVIQCIERALGWSKETWTGFERFTRVICTFVIATIAWVLFRANNLYDAFVALRLMVTPNDLQLNMGKMDILFSVVAIFIILIKEYAEEMSLARVHQKIQNTGKWAIRFYLASMIVLIGSLGVFDGGKFIYFQF